MKRCPKCAEKIQNAATVCRYCHAPQPKVESNKVLLIAIGAILLVGIALSQPKRATSVSTASAPKPIDGRQCKGLNGESRNFAGLVKQRLRNPASFEHVSTQYRISKPGVLYASMTYRGTNGFGAVDTAIAEGEVRMSDCAAKVLSM